MPTNTSRKLKFIGCEILYREACLLTARSPHHVDVQFLRKALHSLETPEMVAAMQEAVDAVDTSAGYDAILLGYARCNDGVVGLTARQVPLIIPRAHDCITFFFGARGAYKKYFDRYPGTYYMTTGWAERDPENDQYQHDSPQLSGTRKTGLNQSYEQLVAKYGKENADFIAETLGHWIENYSKMLYVRMGVCDEEPFIADSRRRAEQHGWDFEIREGDWTLLEKLFFGKWDEDFVIVPPGRSIVARNDEWVLDVSS